MTNKEYLTEYAKCVSFVLKCDDKIIDAAIELLNCEKASRAQNRANKEFLKKIKNKKEAICEL